jgi:hypothetical protein
MLRLLLDGRTAVIAAILIALDPFYIALSRVLHVDAVTAALMIISVVSVLLHLKRQYRWGYLALSGASAALAMLNKAPAAFLVPFVGLLLATPAMRAGRSLSKTVRAILVWVLVAGLVAFALWPALWVDAKGVICSVISTAVGYGEQPHSNSNFFWGQIRPDPGPFFYPVAWAFRTTPVVMLGLLLCVPVLIKNANRWRPVIFSLLAFGLLFAASMTLGAKKFDRYLLPAFLALDIVAAAGLSHFGETPRSRMGGAHLPGIVSICTIVICSGLVVAYHPYYFSYYNPLVGGSSEAPNTMLVGWGEGLEKAAEYLNRKGGASTLSAAVCYTSAFAPHFLGRTIDMNSYDPAATDYVVIYLCQRQRNLYPELITEYYDSQEPEYTVSLHGIEYAWVYPNLSYRAPMHFISSCAVASEDVVLVSRPSLFEKHYDGDLPLHVMDPTWGEVEIVAELQKAIGNQQRVWYVKYLQDDPDFALDLIDYQLSTHLFKLEEHVYPSVALYLFQAFQPTSFEVSDIDARLDLNFEGELVLRGYSFADRLAQSGREFGIVLRWEALQDLDRPYAAFIHLVDDQGVKWGQGDKWLLNESLVPAAGWRAGDVVTDRYRLLLRDSVLPGEYTILIGLYDPDTGERLDILDASGALIGQSYELGSIEVRPSPLGLPRGDAVEG